MHSLVKKLQGNIGRWFGPLLVAGVFVLLACYTWRKWADILIDFGRELYVPWQLLEGRVLYRDLAYLNGPLSPYVNAFFFWLFGPSLQTLIFCNLALLCLLTSLIFYLATKTSDDFTATLSCIAFLVLFGFAHSVESGNYNYICPYSHEMTHGILLFFISLALVVKLTHNFLRIYISFLGIILGLIFLGKAEIFIAAAVAILCGIFLLFFFHNLTSKNIVISFAIFLISFLFPIVFFWSLLSTQMPMIHAFKGISGTWANLNILNVSKIKYYSLIMGFNSPFSNLINMWLNFIGILMTIVSLLFIQFIKKHNIKNPLFLCLIIIIFCGGILIKNPNIPFILPGRSLPLWSFATSCIFLYACVINRFQANKFANLILLSVWSIFGLFLLAKIVLNAKIMHYGFVLAMPATLLLIIFFTGLISIWLQKSFNQGYIFRYLIIFFITVDIFFLFLVSNYFYEKKNYKVGHDDNYILSYDPEYDVRGKAVNVILQNICDMPEIENILVLPEGIMINFMIKKPSPIEFYNFMLPEMIIFGENNMLLSIKNNSPKYILFLERDTSEYGVKYFGQQKTYGNIIMKWIKENYSILWQIRIDHGNHIDMRSPNLMQEITAKMFKKYDVKSALSPR
jgi:hypothetical protein